MTKERSLNWGETYSTPVPETATCAWGARAIFTPLDQGHLLDFLPDRMDSWGDEDKSFRKAVSALDGPLMKLKDFLRDQGVRPDDRNTVTFEVDDIHISASPNASFGYLYIVAWRE